MNKADLIAQVSQEANVSKAQAAAAVDAVFDTITAALKTGEEVKMPGFGSFVVAARAASKGRNPKTGEAIDIPASKLPKFKAGKGLREAVK